MYDSESGELDGSRVVGVLRLVGHISDIARRTTTFTWSGSAKVKEFCQYYLLDWIGLEETGCVVCVVRFGGFWRAL